MEDNLIEIQALYVNYGRGDVINGLSLGLVRGELTAVIGPNGAGKTSLVKAISGDAPIRSGRVLVDGKDIRLLPPRERARSLAVVPQVRQLPVDVPVYQTVLLGRTPYINWLGMTGTADHAHVRRAMEQVQITELEKFPIGELSGGEQQRVLLARALAQQTPILLLDEPTTHLDLQHQMSLLNLLKRLVKEHGLTIIMVLHDLNLAGLYADRIVLMSKGAVFASGSPREVINADALTATFGVALEVIPHPQYGAPLVLPDGLNPRS